MEHTNKFRISFIINYFFTLWSFLILINSIGISTPKTILSYVLLEKGNPQNKWNKVVLFGLFSSFIVRLILQIKKNK